MDVLRNVENELKSLKSTLSDKEDRLIFIQKSLDRERDEKMSVIEEKNKDDEEWLTEKHQWQLERQELKQKISEMIEATKNEKNSRISDAEANEMQQAYHKVLKDKESLENESSLLKQENKRLQMIIANPHELDQMKNSMVDEDFGYSSSRNTLEKQHQRHASSSQLSEGDFLSLQHSNIQNNNSTSSTLERKFKKFFGFSNRGGKRDFLSFNWSKETN